MRSHNKIGPNWFTYKQTNKQTNRQAKYYVEGNLDEIP